MTITEAILAQHAGRDRVSPGETVWIDVDTLMTHDVCGPPTIEIFKREFGDDARVWDPEKVWRSSRTTTSLRPTSTRTATSRSCAPSPPSTTCRTTTTSAATATKASATWRWRRKGFNRPGTTLFGDRQPHVHLGRLRPVLDRHRQHGRGAHYGDRQDLGQGAGVDAVRLRGRPAAVPDGERPDLGCHRRHRDGRRDVPGDGVRRAARSTISRSRSG